MDTKKIIKNFNERLRVARNKYGENSRLVKMMIDRAKMVVELDWTAKGISTKKSNIEAINSKVLEKRVSRFIEGNSARRIIEKTLTPEQIKEHRSDLGEFFNKVMANKELCERIWSEMYEAGYTPDECNEVYNELMAGKYSDILDKFVTGEISIVQLADKILSGAYDDKYADIPDFDDDF